MGLESVEIVMEIEDRFGVSIPDARASAIYTAGEMRDEIVRLLIERGEPDTLELRRRVWEQIVAIVVRVMAMRPDQIKPESRWAGDITRYG